MSRIAVGCGLVALVFIVKLSTAGAVEPGYRVERMTILKGPEDALYFQSRGALMPETPARVLVTTQEIDRRATHAFRDVFQVESTDGGKTWTQPERIVSLRRVKLPNGDERVGGDLLPQWHAKTGVVLATGKTFTFRGGTKEDRSIEQTSYCVYSPKSRTWGDLRIVELPSTDHAGLAITGPNTGCCQRFDLPNGDILLPIRYSPEKYGKPYTTIVALCRFDGQTLSYVRHGSEFTLPRGRGLYEPSVIGDDGKFYLTMRSDDSAFVARSDDGLNYEPMVEWKFDDGSVLGSYNTQQHWIAHGDALYLVYTRRDANNDHIFRHRSPLFMAQVDPERLCVLRDTEQVLMPEDNAALGNGGVIDISPDETWFIDSEDLNRGPRENERNKVLVAKILWAK